MKSRYILDFVIIFIFSVSGVFAASAEINKILNYISAEVRTYNTFPPSGWWEIESLIKKKHNIIIPNNQLATAQKHYVRLIIEKNIDRYSDFDKFSKAHNFPKNMIVYAADYFFQQKKKRDNTRTSNNTVITNAANNNRKKSAVDINAHNPYMSYPVSIEQQQKNTSKFEKKMGVFSDEISLLTRESDSKISEYPEYLANKSVIDTTELEKTNELLSAIRAELSVKKSNKDNLTEVYFDDGEIERLKTNLDFALITISKLNDTLKQFIMQIDMRYDKLIQNALNEYNKMQIQVSAANKIIADLAQYYYNLLDDNSKRNLVNIIIDDSRAPADNLIELSFIIREYQKSNVSYSELLKRAADEIEKLKNENKFLRLKVEIEYETLLKENKGLKEKLLLNKTN